MDPKAYLLVILVCFTMLLCDGVEGGRWNISAKEDLEFERQVKILNKPSIKTINTDFGDTFDCVDFYKQPAFDYALMNNYTIEYEKPISLQNRLRDHLYNGTEGEGCPIGSVPIKRITKEDLIREKLNSEEETHVGNTLGANYAVVRTKPCINKFVGAGSAGSIWNPPATGREYSAARLKISSEDDSIEVGWRVDPTLYGDTRTRIYVRTDTGRSHCFDTRCGFVIVDTSIRVGNAFPKPSKHGGPVYEVSLFIVQNTITGNWYLEYGKDHKPIGFWPKSLFTGLAKLGASAEWGGEVFSPPGTPKPAMGAGSIPSSPDNDYDSYFRSMVLLDGQKTVNVDSLDSIADNINYQVNDVGITEDPLWGHLMYYGGRSSGP